MRQQIICGILTGQIVLRCSHGKDLFNFREKRLKRVLSFSFQVTKCGGLPNNILDVWEFWGKPKHCQYTWDTQMNCNLGMLLLVSFVLIEYFLEPQRKVATLFPKVWTCLGWKNWTVVDFPVITGVFCAT